MFIDSIQENGYTIFVVDGEFPVYDPAIFMFDTRPVHQKFMELSELEKQHEQDIKNPNYKLNSGGSDQLELERVMQESLKEFQKNNQNNQSGSQFNNTGTQEQQQQQDDVFKGQGYQLNEPQTSMTKCKLNRHPRREPRVCRSD